MGWECCADRPVKLILLVVFFFCLTVFPSRNQSDTHTGTKTIQFGNKTVCLSNPAETCKQNAKSSVSRLAEPPLSLLMPYGLMPRTWASPRPSCPMVQLIICSATRKLMLAYASSCSVTTGCQGHNCSGCLTDWFGIRGLGLDQKTSGPLRTWASTPFCPPAFSYVSRSCCGASNPTNCVDRDPADQHKHGHDWFSVGRQELWRAVSLQKKKKKPVSPKQCSLPVRAWP